MAVITREVNLSTDMKNAVEAFGADGSVQLEEALLNSGILYTLILDYEYGKGNLQNVRPVPGSLLFFDSSNGVLKVSYSINEFSMCAAIDYTEELIMNIDFKVDILQGNISLSGEERYERNDEL